MTVRSIWIVVAIALAGLAIALLMPRSPEATHDHDHEHEQAGKTTPTEKPTITDLKVGTGRVAEPGDTVTVHYRLELEGKKVQDTRDRKQPFRFLLGAGLMVKGWDMGVEGMRVGGVRKIVVPPSLGYGERGSEDGTIPPNATLTFTVELLKVEKVEDEPLLDPLINPDAAKSGATGGR